MEPSVFPCSTPATMSKYSVSPSGESTFTLVFLYIESLLRLRFLLVGRILVGFVPSSLCEWNQSPWWSRQIVMSPVGFLPVHLQGFYGWSIIERSWIYFFGSHFGFSYIYIFKHVWLNNKDTFCLYNFIKILSSFLIESWFQVGIGGWIYQNCPEHCQTLHRPSSGVACMYKECFL